MSKAKRAKKGIKNIWKDILIIIFILLFITGLAIAILNMVKWKENSDETYKQIEEVQEISTITEVTETEVEEEQIEIIEPEENIEETNPYWDYIKMNLIDVDFEELKKINSSTVGWLQVNGTNINYPFVQTNDNQFYLRHSFDKTYNKAGWVFLDYRNDITSMGKNTIIYAHGRVDKTMFGSLKTVLSKEWQNNTNNYIVKLSTEKENTLWQVFSVYRIPTTSDYIQVDFSTEEEFLNFANMLINRSAYDFKTNVQSTDKILTLSTCYNTTDKVVLHAKLIKKQSKN